MEFLPDSTGEGAKPNEDNFKHLGGGKLAFLSLFRKGTPYSCSDNSLDYLKTVLISEYNLGTGWVNMPGRSLD
jgi:hypothetical protein